MANLVLPTYYILWNIFIGFSSLDSLLRITPKKRILTMDKISVA